MQPSEFNAAPWEDLLDMATRIHDRDDARFDALMQVLLAIARRPTL